ncbi:MAG: DUF1194 domain-containing protein [Hyphomicrobiaceae bacterium]
MLKGIAPVAIIGHPTPMESCKRVFCVVVLSLAVVFASGLKASAEIEVDLQLVLAVDVSLSMDEVEQRLQRDGFIEAFREPEVVKAITTGEFRRIAVTYVEWGGAGFQRVVVPWRVIDGEESAAAFSRELAAQPIRREQRTSISQALIFSSTLFENSGLTSKRRVIDVSGDGPNNSGLPVAEVRDKLVSAGIIINGLAIQLPRSTSNNTLFDLPDLDRYYADCVVGGEGSFVLPIVDQLQFGIAIRQKLLLEIADLGPHRPEFDLRRRADTISPDAATLIYRAQFSTGSPWRGYDCLIGEKRWEMFIRGRRY